MDVNFSSTSSTYFTIIVIIVEQHKGEIHRCFFIDDAQW